MESYSESLRKICFDDKRLTYYLLTCAVTHFLIRNTNTIKKIKFFLSKL